MTLLFKCNENKNTHFFNGQTILDCLGRLDAFIYDFYGIVLMDDLAFELEKCIECLKEGKIYSRFDFSTPEDDFSLEIIDIVQKGTLGE